MLVSNRTSLSVKAKEGIQAPIVPVDWDGIMSRQAFLAFAPFRPEVGDYGYVAITRAVLCFSASLNRHMARDMNCGSTTGGSSWKIW
jgi:hypothetical protein